METGQLIVYTVVHYFDDEGEHQEKEVILFERPDVTLDEALEYIKRLRRQQPPEDRPTRRLRRDDLYAVWAQRVTL